MESRSDDSETSVPEAGVFTYVQYIGRGPVVLGERKMASRDLVEANRIIPVGTICFHFFERAEAVVGGEVLRGRMRDRSIGYTDYTLHGDRDDHVVGAPLRRESPLQ
jgi:hypothetical protein